MHAEEIKSCPFCRSTHEIYENYVLVSHEDDCFVPLRDPYSLGKTCIIPFDEIKAWNHREQNSVDVNLQSTTNPIPLCKKEHYDYVIDGYCICPDCHELID